MEKNKEILLLLSDTNIDGSFLPKFESQAEMFSFIFFVVFGIIYFIALVIDQQFVALISATLSILFLLIHSVAYFIKDLPFLKNPVKSYVGSLCVGLDKEGGINKKLMKFSSEELEATKSILEFEYSRITRHTQFIMGAIDKVGIFPSILALFYSYHKYQTGVEKDNLSYLILGAVIGVYLALLLLQRVTNWHKWALYLLSNIIDKKNES